MNRCKLAYNLLTRTNDDERAGIQRRCPDWFLYGANEELTICYFEKPNGKTVEVDL